MPDNMRGMNNQHRRKNFTLSDDALIRQQPVTGIGLRRLALILRTNQEAIRQRATELGVSLVIGAESDGAIDTRTLRCTDGFVDPLLERLKDVHGK
jgi:3-deoxy-D-manno-octulosonate 8-phosphate phosphatase KdsC-like HAD superfamily phosphatase